jgi:hypothetical protein
MIKLKGEMFRVEDALDQFTGSTVHVASTEHHLNNVQEVQGNGVKRVASMISSSENACHLEKNNPDDVTLAKFYEKYGKWEISNA